MKKIIVFVVAAVFFLASITYAGSGLGLSNSPGPAPNSHDGISDGSGFDSYLYLIETLNMLFFGPGPAPNSGDGVPDGSGFEVPPKGAK